MPDVYYTNDNNKIKNYLDKYKNEPNHKYKIGQC